MHPWSKSLSREDKKINALKDAPLIKESESGRQEDKRLKGCTPDQFILFKKIIVGLHLNIFCTCTLIQLAFLLPLVPIPHTSVMYTGTTRRWWSRILEKEIYKYDARNQSDVYNRMALYLLHFVCCHLAALCDDLKCWNKHSSLKLLQCRVL
jgi:hypothetical protein